ncbi:hypothetical protein HDU78_005753, partial [Chytriomyces hyalinus]
MGVCHWEHNTVNGKSGGKEDAAQGAAANVQRAHEEVNFRQIEAQEAVVEEREAALLDAIKRNDKVYQNAVVRLNRLMDEKKDLKALLAQKEPSTVAKDIA